MSLPPLRESATTHNSMPRGLPMSSVGASRRSAPPCLQTPNSRHIVTTRHPPKSEILHGFPDPLDEAELATKTIAAVKAKTRKDYVSSFATAVTRLASNSSDLLAVVPQILVS